MEAEPSIITFVRERLIEPDQSMADIAQAIGLSKRWVELMRVPGAIPNPGIQGIEALLRHYGHRLEVVPERRGKTKKN